MSTVTLYGPSQSTYVRTARMICEEKGVDYTLEPLKLGSEDHLKRHPFGRVPIFRHGEFEIIETSAIGRYVDAAFDGPPLQPTEPRKLAVMEQWISTINSYYYDDLIRNYVFQYLFPRTADGSPDRAAIDAGLGKVRRDLVLLDAALEGKDYIVGDLTLADLFIAPIMFYVAQLPEAQAIIADLRHVTRAEAAMKERASFHNTMPTRP